MPQLFLRSGTKKPGTCPGFLIFSEPPRKLLYCLQRLIEILDEVIRILDADGEADGIRLDAYLKELAVRKLRVSG